jgi:predicted transcriptional regulator
MKNMTLRLDDERAATLEMIARAEDKSVTDAVRTAIDEHIEARRKDQAFMDRLKQRHQRERELYERLAK